MKFSRIAFSLILAFILNPGPSPAHGGSSPNVPVDDHAYWDIDRLVATGLIKDAIYGQRPWSRHEIARMIREARRHLPELGSIAAYNPDLGLALTAEEIIENLEREYRDELAETNAGPPIYVPKRVSLEAALLDSPFRAAPEYNGLGNIQGSLNPLVSYREGRRYADGGTFALESIHWARPSGYFSVYARPRFEILVPRNGSNDVNVRAQTLYGKFTYRNLEMEVGRDSLIWGPGEYGGVLASNNARNLDIAKASNDSPFVHPWFFRYLGPSKYTFFVARLGSEYALKNAYLYGLAASFKPASALEVGFKHQVTVGGEGAPDTGLWQMIREFFFIRGARYPQESMDNREGFDVRLQIPQWRNAVVYAEGVFEDFGRESFWPQFTEWMGFSSGLHFPLLTADGSNDLRIEYEHSPPAYGRHFLYASGLTVDDRLRGSELGPDGTGIHVTWKHSFPSGTQMRNEAHFEDRGNDLYTQTPTSKGEGDRVIRLTNNPTERRFRFVSSFDWKFNQRWTIRPQFGYERVRNYNFAPRASRNNFLGAVSLAWFPE